MHSTGRIDIGVGMTLFLMLTAPTAFAQGPGALGAGGAPPALGGNNLIMIVMAPAVQQELKFSDEQKNKVFELAREANRKGRDFLQSMMQGNGGNPQALMMAGARMRQENEKAVAQILEPKQKERAEQIQLRVEGPLAVARPEIAQKVGLKREQIQMVQVTMLQMMQAQRQFLMQRQGAGFNPDAPAAGRATTARIREAAVQQVSRILDAKQKFAFNKLLGEPFDISKIDPDLASSSAPSTSSSDAAPPSKTAKASARRKKGAPAKGAAPKDGDEDPKPPKP